MAKREREQLFPSMEDNVLGTPPFIGDKRLGEPVNEAEWANVAYSTDENGRDMPQQAMIPIGDGSGNPYTLPVTEDIPHGQSKPIIDTSALFDLAGTQPDEGIPPRQDTSSLTRPRIVDPVLAAIAKNPVAEKRSALDAMREEARNGKNKDKGFKGVLKDIFDNIRANAGAIRPGMGLGETLAILGAGAAGGVIDRSANERRKAASQIPMLEQDVLDAERGAYNDARTQTIYNDDKRQGEAFAFSKSQAEAAEKARKDKAATDLKKSEDARKAKHAQNLLKWETTEKIRQQKGSSLGSKAKTKFAEADAKHAQAKNAKPAQRGALLTAATKLRAEGDDLIRQQGEYNKPLPKPQLSDITDDAPAEGGGTSRTPEQNRAVLASIEKQQLGDQAKQNFINSLTPAEKQALGLQ